MRVCVCVALSLVNDAFARLDTAELTSIQCPISGTPAELPRWVLPSNGDVLRYWRLLLKNEQQFKARITSI